MRRSCTKVSLQRPSVILFEHWRNCCEMQEFKYFRAALAYRSRKG